MESQSSAAESEARAQVCQWSGQLVQRGRCRQRAFVRRPISEIAPDTIKERGGQLLHFTFSGRGTMNTAMQYMAGMTSDSRNGRSLAHFEAHAPYISCTTSVRGRSMPSAMALPDLRTIAHRRMEARSRMRKSLGATSTLSENGATEVEVGAGLFRPEVQ